MSIRSVSLVYALSLRLRESAELETPAQCRSLKKNWFVKQISERTHTTEFTSLGGKVIVPAAYKVESSFPNLPGKFRSRWL